MRMDAQELTLLDDRIISVLSTNQWVTVSRIGTLINETYGKADEDDYYDNIYSNENIAFRCGVLLEQGKIKFDSVEHYADEINFMFRLTGS